MKRLDRKKFDGVVYTITNNITGEVYVGCTCNYKQRKKTHKGFMKLKEAPNSCRSVLNLNFAKYGVKDYSFKKVLTQESRLDTYAFERLLQYLLNSTGIKLLNEYPFKRIKNRELLIQE